ncbi:hypothetical protein QYE76_003153 [Lolium multiflorum]|uniref:DUF4283 domain-containing protein n=1 Tax=Lolium multiflorum TaxID=4521 RepID=A0AAD8RPL6_LOLMU|nr:hypothetical protein QYE76_003153 [Lolium multiflorum]
MADKAEASKGKGKKEENVDDLLGRLHLEDDEVEDFVWEDEVPDSEVKAKWLAIARVHTSKLGFSQSALFSDMRSAWNPAKEVTWRRIEQNLFTIQFNCLADWNKAMNQGPWLFRDQGLIMEEYDGFTNPLAINLDKITVWAQIHKLPDNYLKEHVIRGMSRCVGEVLEVQIKLPAGFIGSFVRLKIKLDTRKKLSRFVSMTRDKKKEYFQVKYEKMPDFCAHCGMIGHWYEECGTGEHDQNSFEWGDFILADGGRGRGRSRGQGRGQGSRSDGVPARGRGRGRGIFTANAGGVQSEAYPSDMDYEDFSAQNPNARKRLALNSCVTDGAMVVGNTGAGVLDKVAAIEERQGTDKDIDNDLSGTPQKNANKKKARKDGEGSQHDTNTEGSAASLEEDRREQ